MIRVVDEVMISEIANLHEGMEFLTRNGEIAYFVGESEYSSETFKKYDFYRYEKVWVGRNKWEMHKMFFTVYNDGSNDDMSGIGPNIAFDIVAINR